MKQETKTFFERVAVALLLTIAMFGLIIYYLQGQSAHQNVQKICGAKNTYYELKPSTEYYCSNGVRVICGQSWTTDIPCTEEKR